MLSLDETIVLSTWLSFGVAGALVLLDSWREWTQRDLPEHIGVFRFALFALLTAGGFGTLLLAAVFRHVHGRTRPRQKGDASDRDTEARPPSRTL